MKRPASWKEVASASSDDSSDSDSDDDKLDRKKNSKHFGDSKNIMDTMSEANIKKKKVGGIDYEALSKHGYHGGPSVLKVPPPRVEEKEQNWSWSTGKDGNERNNSTEEPFEERERTRAAAHGKDPLHVQVNLQLDKKDKKASFSQKEKRKRDLGQASRGKNYVEEEKRLLRDSGVYSGFDS
ncbi:UPF0690 protein C1orf52 homolog [Phalaenopsis equestris]|uniref:UPF0690 protein C1orf52 homolog n=1 Tax=Phalaenopsis equestris TaxID=78828 RepID=UPI0009E2A567|nr:UPF0690 protein C1orf52 homolog [Phalaenopsis equestris]XP_020586044.1 UPF0690 protein C1orf52 homolog [Phalaenopsis equestris]XP_020586045.1 UPF0690 protein C1orf52 homolog [Phalaenopsis equestris]XP_020586046.1 UPF0690 protein C1orf52 homolog [Phalaenopsis equestris]XP_020586047.1 UPF0690 protein C1orf52 homolog [Phalaenopsis equestris]